MSNWLESSAYDDWKCNPPEYEEREEYEADNYEEYALQHKVTKVDKARYYSALKKIFSDGDILTAREASIELHNRFDLGDATRGCSHPRILELIDKGYLCRVEQKKYDAYTKKMVTAYQRAGE